MISISYLKPLCKACNIRVNHVTSEQECLRDSVLKRVKTFTKVISKLSRQQKFAIIRENFDVTTMAFAECCHKFRGLQISQQWKY